MAITYSQTDLRSSIAYVIGDDVYKAFVATGTPMVMYHKVAVLKCFEQDLRNEDWKVIRAFWNALVTDGVYPEYVSIGDWPIRRR